MLCAPTVTSCVSAKSAPIARLIRLGAIEVVEHLIETGDSRGLDRLLRHDVALDRAEGSGA